MSDAFPPPSETVIAPGRDRRGLIALVLGIVAVVLAAVPVASYIAWLVGIAAIVLGILAVLRATGRKRAGIAGIVLGAVAVILSLVMSVVYTVLFIVATASSGPIIGGTPAASDPAVGSGTSHRVVYSVTGEGRATAIAYYTVSGGQSGQSTLQDEALPWSKTVTVRGGLTSQSSVLTVVGRRTGAGSISCSITLDGEVVATQTGEGTNATAQCIYRPEG